MFHNIICEVSIRDGVIGTIDEKSSGSYIFRLVKPYNNKHEVVAVANVTEKSVFGVFECYTEATKIDDGFTIEDFLPLFQILEFHIAWYKRKPDDSGKLIALPINKEYYKHIKGYINDIRRVFKSDGNTIA